MIPAIATLGRDGECSRCAPGGCCPACGDAPDATSGDAWECYRCDYYFTELADCAHLDAAVIEARVAAVAHVSACQLGCSSARPSPHSMLVFVAADGCDQGVVLLAGAGQGVDRG